MILILRFQVFFLQRLVDRFMSSTPFSPGEAVPNHKTPCRSGKYCEWVIQDTYAVPR